MMNIKAHGSEENHGIDRISNLPDDVRTHILSFFSTREAVQTCILSKRWINTWASVLDLKFDMKEFGWVSYGEMGCEEIVTKFKRFVKNVLDKRETSYVNRFRLWLNSYGYWPCTQAAVNCIGDVMKMEPRECSVKLYLHENLNVNTDAIFTCASLIYLQLFLLTDVDRYVATEPNSVNLSCLKTLNLDGVTMSDDSFKKLLLGCPVLEELVLQGCYIGLIDICSNTLKKLVLNNCDDVMRLQISVPNLLYLETFWSTREILLLNISSVVDASIYLHGWYYEDKYVTMGPKLIHSLSNVESLRLEFGCPIEKIQKKDFSSCPVFNNLKCLELVSWGFHVFELAPYFLHHSPKLQELTLSIREAGWVMEGLDVETTQEGPRDALVQRVFFKTVRIIGLNSGDKLVDRIIKELLAHVKIIGEIVFGYQWEPDPIVLIAYNM